MKLTESQLRKIIRSVLMVEEDNKQASSNLSVKEIEGTSYRVVFENNNNNLSEAIFVPKDLKTNGYLYKIDLKNSSLDPNNLSVKILTTPQGIDSSNLEKMFESIGNKSFFINNKNFEKQSIADLVEAIAGSLNNKIVSLSESNNLFEAISAADFAALLKSSDSSDASSNSENEKAAIVPTEIDKIIGKTRQLREYHDSNFKDTVGNGTPIADWADYPKSYSISDAYDDYPSELKKDENGNMLVPAISFKIRNTEIIFGMEPIDSNVSLSFKIKSVNGGKLYNAKTDAVYKLAEYDIVTDESGKDGKGRIFAGSGFTLSEQEFKHIALKMLASFLTNAKKKIK